MSIVITYRFTAGERIHVLLDFIKVAIIYILNTQLHVSSVVCMLKMLFKINLSHDVAAGSDICITPCNIIDKPMMK